MYSINLLKRLLNIHHLLTTSNLFPPLISNYVSKLQYSVVHDRVHCMMEWTKLWPFTVSVSVVLHCLNSCRTRMERQH